MAVNPIVDAASTSSNLCEGEFSVLTTYWIAKDYHDCLAIESNLFGPVEDLQRSICLEEA